MSSRERRLLDKDKEIRKLKSSLGHYFMQTMVNAIKLKIATDALKEAQRYICSDKKSYQIIQKALEQINKGD